VEVVILDIKKDDKRIGLGLKQALGNPWDTVETRFAPGTIVEVPVTSVAQFGAFVDLGEGIEGMIHVGDITREKRIQHAKEVLSPGQVVKAAVLEVDKEKRRIRLSMKQLEPTSADVFISEHAVGETLMGRVIEVHGNSAKIELAEGVHSRCKTKEEPSAQAAVPQASDVQDLAAMLSSRWKGGTGPSAPEGIKPGQIRSFKITAIDVPNKRIDIEIAE
jgi:small subunit ribosomal protein S1